jgi:hypothetical protein
MVCRVSTCFRAQTGHQLSVRAARSRPGVPVKNGWVRRGKYRGTRLEVGYVVVVGGSRMVTHGGNGCWRALLC